MAGEKSVQEQSAVPKDSQKREEVTIKFGKGLVGEPFISRTGKELVEIKIPNRDARDHRPWESFVVSPKMVHENQYGAGVWMKIPADGTTKVSRPEYRGRDESGKSIWGTESRTVSNQELKALMESYKERNRESVRSVLEEKKADSGIREKPASARTAPSKEMAR